MTKLIKGLSVTMPNGLIPNIQGISGISERIDFVFNLRDFDYDKKIHDEVLESNKVFANRSSTCIRFTKKSSEYLYEYMDKHSIKSMSQAIMIILAIYRSKNPQPELPPMHKVLSMFGSRVMGGSHA